MDLNIVTSPEDEEVIATNASLASPMSKGQRRLSLSAKWASNKALALEYLKRQREVVVWMEHILGDKLPSTDLHESLKSGIVLRELLEKLFPDVTRCLSPISRKYSTRMAPWKERENISVFLKQCKVLGMNDLSLFCTDDLYDGNNMVQVMFCVQDFMRFSQEHSEHFLHPVYDEHVTFSNQDVENALSKIEKAGMDASKLKDLMNGPSSGSSSPGQKGKSGSEDFDDTDVDSLFTSSDAEKDPIEIEETALNDLETELQALAENERLSNQSSEAELDDQDKKFEPELDNEAGSEHEPDEAEDDDDEYEEYEEEIVDLLSDLVDAVEEAHDAELEGDDAEIGKENESITSSEEHEAEDDDDEMKYSTEAALQAKLEVDLEEAKRTSLPESSGSEILAESEMLVTFSAKHRIESEARTELMDVGKSDTMVLDVAEATRRRFDQVQGHGGDEAAATAARQDAKPSKKKLKAPRNKKNRESSNEPLDVEAMSRCTCGSKCSIM